MNPLVSIIMPTYNGAKRITGAITSVLNQTYANWELLIIDDGSTDQTKAVVEKFVNQDTRIILIENQHNSGIQISLNNGIAAAQGKYVARLDDDDRWIDLEKLSSQVTYLEQYPDCVVVGSHALVVDVNGITLSKNTMPLTDQTIRKAILSRNCFLHATVMIRKSALEKEGGYSTSKHFLHAEDYELWLRLGKTGTLANLDVYTTALTAHAQSLTASNRVSQARNTLRAAWRYKNSYPNSFKGIVTATLRYLGFATISITPFPQSWLYRIQRIYRAV